MCSDDSKCVNCHRCVALCPTRALKIVKTDHTFKENANWRGSIINEIYKQAESGAVLLSSMGNPNEYPVYFDKILLNASRLQILLSTVERAYGNKSVLGSNEEYTKR